MLRPDVTTWISSATVPSYSPRVVIITDTTVGTHINKTRKNSFLISLQPDDEIYRLIDRLQCWYGHVTSREGPT